MPFFTFSNGVVLCATKLYYPVTFRFSLIIHFSFLTSITSRFAGFIGKGLIVPKYFFMALLRVKNGVYNAMGFWIEHKASDDKRLAKYAVSIKELEEKTDIDFFCNLPDNIESTVENAAVNNTFWGLD